MEDENLPCERETGNLHDPQAMAVKKMIDGTLQVVGHAPRKISSICSIFIRRGGSIACRVTGHQQYSSNLPQGGLELPCVLTFTTASAKDIVKQKRYLSVHCLLELGKPNQWISLLNIVQVNN